MKTIPISKKNYDKLVVLMGELMIKSKQIKSFDKVIDYLLKKAGVE